VPRSQRAFVSAFREVEHGAGNHHTLFSFIPPHPGHRFAAHFDWQEKKDYFETNPNFYSMAADGQRVPCQLCFGNRDLRAELTRQVARLIGIEGDDVTVSICAMDAPRPFCTCTACGASERKYQSPGGPLYDYLFELCGILRKHHPAVRVFTIAYRRSQTQIPPTLPEGQLLPPNLVVSFAPIEDSLFADWTHPDTRMQETYGHLKSWAAITRPGNLMGFYYGPYGAAGQLPFADVYRLITQMRLMHATGVRGIHLDQSSTHNRALFGELRSYLVCKLRQSIDADTEAIIREFTDFMYGPAAPLIRTYLAELEGERTAMIAEALPRGMSFHAPLDPDNFRYLTPENIRRWQGYLDRMAAMTADAPQRCRTNVQLARRQLDLATLWKWFDLRADHPQAYRDHRAILARLRAANDVRPPLAPEWEQKAVNRRWDRHPLGEAMAEDFATIIKGGGRIKPLPPELVDLAPGRVRRFVPANRFAVAAPGYPPVGERTALDPDAAFGYAATTYLPEQQPRQKLPFVFGCRPARRARSVTRSVTRSVSSAEIRLGVYGLYKLGRVTLTPESEIWMPEWSCSTMLEIGRRLYEPGADNCWEIYASLKFDGPTYGGAAGADRVWCDQIIAVRADRE